LWPRAGAQLGCVLNIDQAFAWLDRAHRQREPYSFNIKTDPWLQNLKSDPRYKVLLRKLKLPE
jgi:hypothetical protein